LKVRGHPDPVVLESELLRRVEAVQSADPAARVLIIVPTARLTRHVQRRLGEAHGARLNVEVLHHRAVARSILASGPEPAPRLIPDSVLETLAGRVLRGMPRHPWGVFASARPGAIRSFLATLTDLREAGLDAGTLHDALGRNHPAVTALSAWERVLDALAGRGFVDETGYVGAALSEAETWGSRYALILHHGAYELTGTHLDLVRALDRQGRVEVLLPAATGAPAYAAAVAFASRHLLAPGESIEPIDAPPAGAAGGHLTTLYDEAARPAPLPPQVLDLAHVQGGAAEAALAVRRALACSARGVPAHEVAIVSRSMDGVAWDLESALRRDGVPSSGSWSTPRRRHPALRDVLLLLRIVVEDFPRGPTCEVLASPRVRWDALGTGEASPPADGLDALTRRAGLLGGLEGWTHLLPAWAERRTEDDRTAVRSAAAIVRALAGAVDARAPGTWSAHAAAIGALAGALVPDAAGGLADLLLEMQCLDVVLAGGPVPRHDAVAWLDDAVDGAREAAAGNDRGVQVLDVMQARGLTFQTVVLVGVHGGSFPRAPRADPWLDDDARERVREATRRPLAVKRDGEAEERLLLALVLGAARATLHVSWQRADDAGRLRPVSLALREIARLATGSPRLEALTAGSAARRFPAHPAAWIAAVGAATGLEASPEAWIRAAFEAADRDGGRLRLATIRPELAARLRLLDAIESFETGNLRADGVAGPAGAWDKAISVSRLETLGRCPLRFFFEAVLGLREPDEELDLFHPDSREIGRRVHEVLRRVYEPILGVASPDPAAAQDRVEASWDAASGTLGRLLDQRVPVLWRAERAQWVERLRRFVGEDLVRQAGAGATLTALESAVAAPLPVGDGIVLDLGGRIDRAADGPEGRVIGDYKTSRDVASMVAPREILRARSLQVPLYWIVDGERARVDVLRLRLVTAVDATDDDNDVASFAGLDAAQRADLGSTLNLLARLLRDGVYPLRASADCSRCPFERGCRHDHPPTQVRLRSAAAPAPFAAVAALDAKGRGKAAAGGGS
jgi:hypothetical protein